MRHELGGQIRSRSAASIFRASKAILLSLVALAVLGTGMVLAAPSVAERQAAPIAKTAPGALNQGYFRSVMRKLWEDHITWTRLYIVSAATLPDALPDLEATAVRLLKNQADIGNAIKRFYGDAAGNRLTALLREHILTAADLIAAAKAGDSAKVADTKAKWYANGNEIASFLSSANPNSWPLADMQDMMKMHLDLTLQEAVDRLGGKFSADIADYDMVHTEILTMADMLSAGIIRQFPEQFRH